MSHKEQTFEVPALPTTVEEFLSIRDALATTPQGGAVVYVVALEAYTRDRELGLQCLTIAMDASQLSGGTVYKNKAPSHMRMGELRQRIDPKPYIARSYFLGTSFENDYAIPSELKVQIRTQERDEGHVPMKVFVHSSGADTPRPIHMVENNRGLWKAKNFSSLDVGVRAPAAEVDDDL